MKIVIAGNDRSIKSILEQYLASDGQQTTSTGAGSDALRAVQLQLPDILLLDAGAMNAAALDVCRAVKADAATRRCKVVLISSRSQPIDIITGFSCGADYYLSWPFMLSDLKTTIHKLAAA
ncbi:MAG TPA: response regulator [Candidatus Edwardsbacteria bacterium]|nr:response regulator [Candidatus Edwardsbacteria bacterium]